LVVQVEKLQDAFNEVKETRFSTPCCDVDVKLMPLRNGFIFYKTEHDYVPGIDKIVVVKKGKKYLIVASSYWLGFKVYRKLVGEKSIIKLIKAINNLLALTNSMPEDVFDKIYEESTDAIEKIAYQNAEVSLPTKIFSEIVKAYFGKAYDEALEDAKEHFEEDEFETTSYFDTETLCFNDTDAGGKYSICFEDVNKMVKPLWTLT